jgi:hypothetical protein
MQKRLEDKPFRDVDGMSATDVVIAFGGALLFRRLFVSDLPAEATNMSRLPNGRRTPWNNC